MVWAIAGILIVELGLMGAAPSGPEPLELGFRQMYNLDFSTAHKTFESWQEHHPEDPLGAASNAAAYMFAEFEHLHILEFDLFTDNNRLDDRGKLQPDPGNKVAFDSELAKADSLASKALARSSKDPDALFARAVTDGLRGTYAALVENNKRVGLDLLKSSRLIAEKLIAIDPTYYDAYLAVGIENYLLGLRSAPVRWSLRLSGNQTSKEKGLDNITVTAKKGRYLAPYARLLLVIAALREGDRNSARKWLSALAKEFPHNRLYQEELNRLRS